MKRTQVSVVDVTLRDGLQDQLQEVCTEDKIRIAEMLVRAGYRELEVTSLMRPDRIPQTADAEDLLAGFAPREGLRRHALVANRKGLERALGTNVEVISFVISASDAHNRKNLNCTTQESLDHITPLIRDALGAGRFVRGTVSTAFGCTIQGQVDPDQVLRVAEGYIEGGVQQLVLADTVGMATGKVFERILGRIGQWAACTELGLHLHQGPGDPVLSLVDQGLEHGIRVFDSAIAGLGGCPFAPGAQGNLKAEALIPHLDQKGIDTGIDASQIPEIALTLGIALGRGNPLPVKTI